jgi:hypothetical protein
MTMDDQTLVPAHPVVDIKVSADAVSVDGEVVDRGSTGGPDTNVAMHLGVHAAARRVAQPLGRPVRAILRVGGDEKHLVIHPDGTVSHVEDTFPVVSLIAPPGSRATPISWAARKPKRRFPIEGTRLAMGAAYVGLGAVLVSGFLVGVRDDGEQTSVAEGSVSENSLPGPPTRVSPHEVLAGTLLDRLPGVSNVVADSGAGGFLLQVTTGRAAELKVVAVPVDGRGESRVWNVQTTGADTRTLAFDGLEAGAYRWTVRTTGEEPQSGSVRVRPTPPPVIVAADTTTDPVPDTSTTPSGNNDHSGGDNDGSDSDLPGPSGPVDPDDPTAR